MGFVGNMFSGDQGLGWKASGTPIIQGASAEAVGQANNQVNSGIDQQQAFLNALSGQNGIGNQSDVFAQQQALANQLAMQAQGQGPNPALAQLANTTGQNIQSQAALMGSQRGISSNPGLLARNIGSQGAEIQQQAAGQGAVMTAQQQLAAQQALMQQQQALAGLATQQVGQQSGALTNYNQFAQGNQANQMNALANFNNANVAMQSNINNANAGIQGKNADAQTQVLGGALGGGGAGLQKVGGSGAAAGAAHGGYVKQYATGALVEPPSASPPNMPMTPLPSLQPMQRVTPAFGPSSRLGQALSGGPISSFNSGAPIQTGMTQFGAGIGSLFASPALAPKPSDAQVAQNLETSRGDPASSSLSGPKMVDDPMAKGAPGSAPFDPLLQKAYGGPINRKAGGGVPGKAKVPGDDLKNDTVKAVLSPGEVVIPRSVMNSKDPVSNAAKFVQAILAKQGFRGKS